MPGKTFYTKSAWTVLPVLFISVWIAGCTVNESLSGKNVSYLYKDLGPEVEVEHKVLNFPARSLVYLRFETQDLGRSEHEDGSSRLNYSLRYRLFANYSSSEVMDSGNVVRKDVMPNPVAIDTLTLRGLEQRSYLLECRLQDLNSPRSATVYIPIRRSKDMNEQSLIVSSKGEGMFYNLVVNHTDSLLIAAVTEPKPELARFYKRDFPVASPPFSTTRPRPFDFTPDEIIRLGIDTSGVRVLPVQKRGFYQLSTDSGGRDGATVFYFGPYFPEAKTVEDLALPLRYITTNQEYASLMDGGESKRKVDEHWLQVAGNPQRARELISAFYGRVQYANRYFSSYLEGWKSDRGMCYIVYGPPDFVYRRTSGETWIYGEEGRYNSLKLTFTKVVNPFTNNDYRLNRSVNLKGSWYRAVEYWRQGRILKYE